MKIIWVAIAVYFLLRAVLYIAAYRGSSSGDLRQRVERHFTAEDIQRGFEYARRAYAARIARGALEALFPVALVLTGLGTSLADRLKGVSFGKAPLQGALLAAALVAALFLLRLPLSYWIDYVVERRWGFSTQTAAGWFLLQAKNLGVALVLTAFLTALWYALVRSFPRAWVVIVPAAFVLFQVALNLILPQVLLPLYYQRTRLPEGSFRQGIERILERGGIGAREVFVIDASRYSRHTNAFFAGFGPTRGIYLFDTLLSEHPEREALTVVAHEAGHWKYGHIAKSIAISSAALLAGCLLLSALYPRLEGIRPLSDPASFPVLWLLAMLAGFFLSPVASAISRKFEREADRAAIELTGDPEAFAEAEKRLVRSNRSQLLPHPFVVFWLYSHPPAIERIEAAERASRR